MAQGYKGLDSASYDAYLAKNGKEREIKKRNDEKKNANKGYEGWHFGIGDKPVHTKNKEEFKRELGKRGLMMRDDVKGRLK